METLGRTMWVERAAAHAARIDQWIQPHLSRRRSGTSHPVHDFLFTYYSQRPARLRIWHPGWGVGLRDAEEYADRKGYVCTAAGWTVSHEHLASQLPLVAATRRLLAATAARPAALGCFGLHEWAMVHRAAPRHDWPLRLGADGTDQVVESHRITCSHFDAFRFFSPTARPLNTLQPARDDRAEFEQPGCLHASMDLYRHAYRLTPLVDSELVADCFALAREVRELDMRASPYDLSALGYEPVRIETIEGKQQYVAAQRDFAERADPLRRRLLEECDRLLEV